MWRALIAAVIFYGAGHPGLDAYRPALLDRPLHGFYDNVNKAAREALSSIDGGRSMRYLRGYIDVMEARLRRS